MKILRLSSMLLVAACVACGGSLPKYAEPQGGEFDPASIQGKDMIAYRELVPEDFLAAEPPEDMRPYAERMGALTCTNVFTFPDPQFVLEQTENGYVGHYLNLDFVAAMDRECSWWNPKDGSAPREYVLQHEQVHFALAESAARELNRKAKAILQREVRGSSLKEVEKEMRGIVQEMMSEAIQELLDRNLRIRSRHFEQVRARGAGALVQ